MKRWLFVIVLVLSLASLITWRLIQKKHDAAAQDQMRARPAGPAVVSLAKAELRDITHTYEATGSVEAPLSVKIAPKLTGRITKLDVHEGDRIKQGQVLVCIDDSEVEANVQQARSAVAEAQYRLAQAKMNQGPTNVSVNTQITQQKAALSSAEADCVQAEKSYEAQVAAANANVADAEAKILNAKASVASAQANLNNAQTKLNRLTSLLQKGFIAAQEVDDAKAAVEVQKSALEIAQGQVKSTTAQRDAVLQQLNLVKAKGDADIQAAKAKRDQVSASLQYAQANTAQKDAYQQSIAALQASVAAAQAGLDSAMVRRRDTVLTAPLDGVVVGRYADPGAITSPTQPVLAVQFVKQVWVSIPVPEEVCAKISIGLPAKLTFDALPGRTFNASVVQVNPSADPLSRQFTVRVILSNTDDSLKPGMFAHVSIETGKVANAVCVPREAVRSDKDGTYVMVVGPDNVAKRRSVTSQGEDPKYIDVGGAVQPGESVVTMSANPVRNDQPVTTGGGGKGAGRK